MNTDPLMQTYGRQPLAFERGEGVWLYDSAGQKYFDAISGIGVTGLGHAHPAVTDAIQRQASQLLHCSNLYEIPLQTRLAEALCEVSDMDRAFFCNSGAEANEAAIKLARLYGHRRGNRSPVIVVLDQAFHGRTLATLTATGNRKVQAGFEPLLSGFVRVPPNDIDALMAVARNNPDIVAVLMEPVQGEGGLTVLSEDYLRAVRQLCDAREWLMMLDEVQSGNGRTGSYFTYQSAGVLPDVVTTAKGLGNGLPIGACLARGEAAHVLTPGSHGSTFGGNPLVCAGALAVVRTIRDQHLADRARSLGQQLLEIFHTFFDGADYVLDIRGKGLMLGIELDDPCPELVPLAKTQGLLINVTRQNVVRLLPPLIMTDAEAEWLATSLVRLIKLYKADERMLPRQTNGDRIQP
ncbi:MAG: aspartate aminotransferase family protein [Gammaproteobacteria bacterium]|nr:MAG: aspartate aminotransferase family protein [Gammaproteobacteria bacterium]